MSSWMTGAGLIGAPIAPARSARTLFCRDADGDSFLDNREIRYVSGCGCWFQGRAVWSGRTSRRRRRSRAGRCSAAFTSIPWSSTARMLSRWTWQTAKPALSRLEWEPEVIVHAAGEFLAPRFERDPSSGNWTSSAPSTCWPRRAPSAPAMCSSPATRSTAGGCPRRRRFARVGPARARKRLRALEARLRGGGHAFQHALAHHTSRGGLWGQRVPLRARGDGDGEPSHSRAREAVNSAEARSSQTTWERSGAR